jgi:hypothetical protein
MGIDQTRRVRGKEGRTVKQITKYHYGVGTRKKKIAKINDGVTGDGCKKQITDIYKVGSVI